MDEKEIAAEIINRAQERILQMIVMNSRERFQNLNSAIHAVKLEVTIHLMKVMEYEKKGK